MILFFVFVSILFLFSCNRTGQPAEDATITTPLEHPATVIASPSTASLKTTDTPTAYPDLPIVYYYFVAIKSNTFPAGSVVILPDVLVLGPTLSEIARTHDAAMDIGSALQAMLNDPRNEWSSTGIGITSITINEGAASVVLQGEFSATGDIVLIAARYQILLTVFAEQSVQTATITLNGENIANLGISHNSQAKPADYAYSREEIKTFMAENAYTAL